MRPELLNNPAWHALSTEHSGVSSGDGLALAYDPDVLPFAALARTGQDADQALLDLIETGRSVGVVSVLPTNLEGWEVLGEFEVVQYIWPKAQAVPERFPNVERLGPEDVEGMLDLTARVYPAYFRRRTAELGPYFGIKHEGTLAAMAGVRLSFAGYGEISAVVVDEGFRGKGFGRMVTGRVAQELQSLGKTPFLHTETHNDPARSLYEKMGFELNQILPARVLQRK